MSTALRVRGLDHVVLRVRDLEKALDFYTRVLGATEERRVDAAGLIQLRVGAHLIDLVPVDGQIGRMGGAPPGEEGRNMDHFALMLEAFDEASLRSHLEACGIPAGSVALRYGALGNGPSMYIRDPDNNVVELKGPPSD